MEHSFLQNKEKTLRLVLEDSRYDSVCLQKIKLHMFITEVPDT